MRKYSKTVMPLSWQNCRCRVGALTPASRCDALESAIIRLATVEQRDEGAEGGVAGCYAAARPWTGRAMKGAMIASLAYLALTTAPSQAMDNPAAGSAGSSLRDSVLVVGIGYPG